MAVSTFIRSSSMANFSFCQMQWFLTYNLGFSDTPKTKTLKGSAVHKVMEDIAFAQLYKQNNPDAVNFVHEGDVYSYEEFYKKKVLSDKEVEQTNKNRKSKTIYKYDCTIKNGHERFGEPIVDEMIKKAINKFMPRDAKPWTKADHRDVREWVYITLEKFDREFDPRTYEVLACEQQFSIPLDYLEWSRYNYALPSGDFSGHLSIKGTIDCIQKEDEESVHIIDYKTGECRDWSTGLEKTVADLQNDKQLKLYNWAVRKLYPNVKNVTFTIFYVRDGGPKTLTFNEDDALDMEEVFREHFEEAKALQHPQKIHPMQLDLKCMRLCSFYKNKLPGSPVNICNQIHRDIYDYGLEMVIDLYKSEDFHFNKYEEPGE